MLKTLTKGDHVVTNGGIIGVIVHASHAEPEAPPAVYRRELTIRTGENTRIVVDRGHIGRKIEAQ